jgi:hypothetical protein
MRTAVMGILRLARYQRVARAAMANWAKRLSLISGIEMRNCLRTRRDFTTFAYGELRMTGRISNNEYTIRIAAEVKNVEVKGQGTGG